MSIRLRLRVAEPRPPWIADASWLKHKISRRDLANEPANILTPMALADRAKAMAAEYGLECEVLDQDRMRQLGMGALLGVAQGSAEPPALIIVRYKPANAPKSQGSPRPDRQGRDVRYRRHLDQALRRHGEDALRHGGRRGGAGRHASDRAIEARDSGDGAGADHREHAGQQGAASGRHREIAVGQDCGSAQHRCRGPADSDRRSYLCASA